MTRRVLYALLVSVSVAAATMSFASLRSLAIVCGFHPWLAPLLPVVVDAGAAAASIVWLGRWAEDSARGYGRTLALILLAGSVAGNALGHGLAAYSARPHWLVVVGVSAIAPTVLGALVHLVVLVGRPVASAPTTVGQLAAATPTAIPRGGVALHAVEDEPTPSGTPDRRSVVNTKNLAEVIDDLRRLSVEHSRRWNRDQIIAMYGISADRAMTARKTLGWPGLPTAPTGTDS